MYTCMFSRVESVAELCIILSIRNLVFDIIEFRRVMYRYYWMVENQTHVRTGI